MVGGTSLNRKMNRVLIIALIAITVQAFGLVLAQEISSGQRLILNVYLDDTGKALITGYAEDIGGLHFLNSSQYRYENDTSQLYAITDTLTQKNGDIWTLNLISSGFYDDYRTTFYLPDDVKLGKINTSDGLEYLLSASNESIVADVQGYEVQNPAITIEYHQPLVIGRSSPSNVYLLPALAILIILVTSLIIIEIRRKGSSRNRQTPETESSLDSSSKENLEASSFKPEGSSNLVEEVISSESNLPDGSIASTELSGSDDDSNLWEDLLQTDSKASSNASKEEIEISSEMAAVMETLTARERMVLETLIDHGGRMTQAEIRYETGTPKSSLTGIMLSLERRKLVTKKEYGRTNVIELSEWFLSRKEE